MSKKTFKVSVKAENGESKSLTLNVPAYWESFSLAKKQWPMDEDAMNEKFFAGVKVDAAAAIRAVCKVDGEYILERFTQSAAQNAVDGYVPVVSRTQLSNGEKRLKAVQLLVADDSLSAEEKVVMEKILRKLQK